MKWYHRGLVAAPVALAAAVAVSAGCGRGTPTAATAPPAPAAGPVELAEASAAGVDQAVREQKGKVVLVDAWFLG